MSLNLAWILILLQSVFCHPHLRNVDGRRQFEAIRSSSAIGTPNAVRTTFDVSVLNGEAVSESGDVITLRSGQMIIMTCKVTYERDLGKHFYTPRL